MNYIPYPRVDKNAHVDLVAWRANTSKKESDWKILKSYLADSCRLVTGVHSITKCWYSELQQGDNYALDVEHFRPKNKAEALQKKDVRIIEKIIGQPLLQDIGTGYSYPWLEFDHRNYRMVTAITNRGGAKHIYFPIFIGTPRLTNSTYPWVQNEYSIFLDPTDRHDAAQLLVKPDGEIIPRSQKTPLTQNDINNLPHSWQSDAFNYTRAIVTIRMYRLNETVFIQGRKEVYDAVQTELKTLLLAINHKVEDLIKITIEKLVNYILPSAQFSLAAKCAITDYIPDTKFGKETIDLFNNAIDSIQKETEELVNKVIVDWAIV